MSHAGNFDELVRDATRMMQSSRAAMLSAAQSAEIRVLLGSLSAACERRDQRTAHELHERIAGIVRDGPPSFC